MKNSLKKVLRGKIERKDKSKKIKISIFALLNVFFGMTSTASQNINLPKEFTQNVAVSGYENAIFDYDFNNDGTDEKVVVSYNEENNFLDVVVSIYTNQNGKNMLSYQITFDKKINILNLDEMPKLLNKVKEYYGEYSKNMASNETRHILIYDDNRNSEILFDKLKFDKHSPKDLDNFLFIKSSSEMLDAPNGKSITNLKYSEKPKLLFEMVSNENPQKLYYTEITKKASTNVNHIKEKKSKIKPKTFKGFVVDRGSNVIKRGFFWDKMVAKMDSVNKFIEEAINAGEDINIITEYSPLSHDVASKKDKFGNKNNQSIVAYTNPNKKGEIINVPDQTLFRILGEEKGMLKIETPFYGGPYYISKNQNNYKKVENINGAVNKFVAIDPSSQAEMLFERDPKTNKYKVVTYSFVTTGKDGSGSYETPHGAFLIAFTRGYMPFTRKAGPGDTPLSGRPDLTIGGVAKFAVRFSGGGYLHGIPVNTHFKGETALTDTAAKIGTYKESHKCVRHFDDQVGFIVDWVNAGSKIKDGDNTIPEEPVVAIVL
ncbi:L,D-transpeptidase family protein [Leptotrichia sp. HSP-334]|uniref:L,D-transpeptidase family protein n=1 Tax=Leptotrichia rugosa TaxID=3239302 RepID=A0AB39VGN3_9FUSO